MFSIADLALMTLWRVLEFKCRAGFLTANQFISVFYSSFMMQPFRKTRPCCQSETMSRIVNKMLRRTIKREVAVGFLVIANLHLPNWTHRTSPGVLSGPRKGIGIFICTELNNRAWQRSWKRYNKKLDWFTHLCPSLICAGLLRHLCIFCCPHPFRCWIWLPSQCS